MSQPAQIPGFYYDPQKLKYFRILPSHAAPTAAFYSTASVATSQRAAARAEEQTREREERARACRNPLDKNPHVRGALRAVVGTSAGDVGIVPVRTDGGNLKADPGDMMPLIHLHSQITSISHSSQWLLCTSMGERHSPKLHLSHLSHAYPGQTHSLPNVRSIWTSSASSDTSTPSFLVGTSNSALHITAHPHTTQQTSHRIKSDVFATCFLPSSSSVFLAGSRDGDMRLFDSRAPSSHAAKGEIVVRHGGTVTHICALSSASVIVNGLSRCAVYDLRYPHPRSPSASFAQATGATRVYDGAVREREFMIGRGFDVDTAGGGEVMVLADCEHWVRLYSVISGEELRRWKWESPCTGLKFDGERRLWASAGKALECFTY
ncbi:hypothetical protein BZA05DRAFT_436170 [Tricharina praecox]|uniref:uncharacterized protein n=1 Tax=Tricharina praecox TaxID=43433 RepID=UPI0022210FAE|nr:uncharacterized protein BZA05DRAFT_436170 [Tricharina praecox]KAI5852323.1 hypothetical protein BZA05DRAFT_436170 [Tricharina praecox]